MEVGPRRGRGDGCGKVFRVDLIAIDVTGNLGVDGLNGFLARQQDQRFSLALREG